MASKSANSDSKAKTTGAKTTTASTTDSSEDSKKTATSKRAKKSTTSQAKSKTSAASQKSTSQAKASAKTSTKSAAKTAAKASEKSVAEGEVKESGKKAAAKSAAKKTSSKAKSTAAKKTSASKAKAGEAKEAQAKLAASEADELETKAATKQTSPKKSTAKAGAAKKSSSKAKPASGSKAKPVGPLRRSLAGDQVELVMGIVNGTTNFILDGMDSTGANYDDMLAEATRLGYAEADPTADVEGHDAASKAAILASLAFHTRVTADDVYCEGISDISADDIAAAKDADYIIKLLAVCERFTNDQGVEEIAARVHPTLIPRSHPLASVNKSFNAIFVEAEAAGRLMFYGNGAGGAPTASAVLGDLVGASRNKVHGGRAPGESTYANLPIASFGDVRTRYHVDMEVQDREGVLAEIATKFAESKISIRTVRQEEFEDHARLIVVTHSATEADLAATVDAIKQLDAVRTIRSVIRLEGH